MNTKCSVTSKTRSLAKIRIFNEKRKLISAVTIEQCEICSYKIIISYTRGSIVIMLDMVCKIMCMFNIIRMKKYTKIAFVAAFAAIAGFNIYSTYGHLINASDSFSNLLLANVEALAQNGESQTARYQTMGTCSMWGGITYKCTSNRTAERCRLDCAK